MKVLIVDDEKFVREAIRIMLEKGEVGISHMYEATNGLEAIEQIKDKKPQIIFTDMRMPMKDGKELLTWIKDNHNTAKTIVISGYDDFEYIRHTLTHGGMDYILKPIDSNELIKITKKAILECNREAEERKQRAQKNITLNTLKPTYLQLVFSDFINGKMPEGGKIKYINNMFPTFKRGKKIQIAIIDIETIETSNNSIEHIQLLEFSILNICNEMLQSHCNGYTFKNDKNNEIIIIFWDRFDMIPIQLQNIWEAIYNTIGTLCHIGYEHYAFPRNKSLTSYQKAKEALNKRNLLKQGNYIHNSTKEHDKVPNISLRPYERELREVIFKKNIAKLQNILYKWQEGVIKEDVITVCDIQYFWQQCEKYVYHWITCFISEEELNVQLPLKPSISDLLINDKLEINQWKNAIEDYLIQSANIIKNIQCANQDNIINLIKKYIHEYYTEDLNMSDLSQKFFMSKEHLSRRFKRETGVNISKYIANVRIEKAKQLLVNKEITVKKVGELVGYQDEKYFYQVFRQLNGISATEYRNKL